MLKNPAKTLVPQVWCLWSVKWKWGPLVLFQFMGSAHLYFPLNREQLEINTSATELQATYSRRTWEGRRAERFLAVTDLLPLTCTTGRSNCRMTRVWSSYHQIRREVSTLCGAAFAFHPSQASQSTPSASLLPLISQSALSREVKGSFAGAGGSPCLPPWPVRSGFPGAAMETVPAVCRRGNVCGIQPLPGVGRREPAFYPVQVPTAGRDVGFKWGAGERTDMTLNSSSETMAGNQFEPPFCH